MPIQVMRGVAEIAPRFSPGLFRARAIRAPAPLRASDCGSAIGDRDSTSRDDRHASRHFLSDSVKCPYPSACSR